jgi:polyisoprenoid-binding protein YceI
MKNSILTAVLAISTLVAVSGQNATWTFDKAHSKISFGVSHVVISEVTGQFASYDGTVTTNGDDFTNAKIDFSIDIGSIDTDNEQRDGHLKSPDFFDVEKYPAITFKSSAMKKTKEGMYQLKGDLTMHGVTKEVSLTAKYGGMVTDPYGNVKAGFKITGTIDRTEFGLKYNSMLDSGGMMIGEEVAITCNVELIKSKN